MKKKRKRQPRLRSEKEYFSAINTINKNAYIYWKCPGLRKYEEELQASVKDIIRTGVKVSDEMKLRLKLCRSTI